eukprot:m.108283 g.108283  ORF g.108283 m.108283 type:complete len:1194 (+) comp14275_c0_seq3:135-3716(+)
MALWVTFKKQVIHATKIALGNIASAIPVFVPGLQYPNCSLAAILYLISTGFGADTVHIGAHIIAAILTFSSGVLGALFSALAILISPNDGVLLFVVCAIIIPICVSLRFGAHSKAVLLSVLTLVFMELNLLSHRMAEQTSVTQSMYYTILSGGIAASAALFFNLAFRRHWATPQVQKLARKTMQAMGKTLTMISSNLVLVQPPRTGASTSDPPDTPSAMDKHSTSPTATTSGDSAITPASTSTAEEPLTRTSRASLQWVLADYEERHLMHSRIKPPPVLVETISPATLQELWTILRTMDGYIKLMPVEQLLLDPLREPLDAHWARVSAALGTSLVQLSAMSTLLGEGGRRYSDHTMMRFWLFAIHELLFDLSAMAATLGTLANHIANELATHPSQHTPLEPAPISTPETRKALLAHILQGFQHYWHVVLTEEDESPGEEVRALLSAGVLWRGLGDSVYQLHVEVNALMAAAAHRNRSVKSLLGNIVEWWRLVALPVVTWSNQARRFSSYFTRKYWQEALQDVVMVFALKQTAIIIILTIVMVLSFPLYTLLGDPYGAWIIVSLLVVMQLSVESTVQRLVFRTIGTATGCALGYAIMYDPVTSTNPGILCAFLFVLIWTSSLFLYTPVRYSIFVFGISANIVVLGQYGKTSAYTYALSRGISVVIGATIAFVASLIFPYYAARSVAANIKKIINDSSRLALFFVNQYITFGLDPDASDPDNHQAMRLREGSLAAQILTDEVLAAAPASLKTSVIGALTALDGRIEKETAAWRIGPFSVPRRVFAAMQELRVISMRLAAFQTSLRRPPVLRGTYGEGAQASEPHRLFIVPLMSHIDALMQAQAALMGALADFVVEKNSVPIHTIVDHARTFQSARQRLIAGLATARASMYVEARHHGDVSAHPEALPLLPDDTTLFCGFFFSWMSVCNAIADMTRTMLPSNVDLSFLSNRQLSSTGLILASAIEPSPGSSGLKRGKRGSFRAAAHGSATSEEEVELKRHGSGDSVTSISSRDSATKIATATTSRGAARREEGTVMNPVSGAAANRVWLPEERLTTLFTSVPEAHTATEEKAVNVADLQRVSLADVGWTDVDADPDRNVVHERLVRDDLALRLELHLGDRAHSAAYTHRVATATAVGHSVHDESESDAGGGLAAALGDRVSEGDVSEDEVAAHELVKDAHHERKHRRPHEWRESIV